MPCRVPDRWRHLRRRGVGLAALVGLSLLASSVPAEIHRLDAEGRPEPVELQLALDVTDPMFAFLMGVLDEDLYGHVDAAELTALITAAGGSKLPIDVIESMDRQPGEGDLHSRVRIRFTEELHVPIPYSILGYNPGSLRASREILLLHWIVGDEEFEHQPKEDEPPVVVNVRDGHLFVIAEGGMEMDIDGWLDRLMRGKLDDVNLSGFFVFRDEGVRIGLGFGYSKKKKGRTGAFDLVKNESIFPASPQYLGLGRTMRERGEGLAKRIAPATADYSH